MMFREKNMEFEKEMKAPKAKNGSLKQQIKGKKLTSGIINDTRCSKSNSS